MDADRSGTVPNPVNGARGVPSPLLSAWAYITQLQMVAEIAAALGGARAADAERYAARAQHARGVFVQAFLRGGGSNLTFADGSLSQQAANALALDVLPNGEGETTAARQAATAAMARAMDTAGNHSIAGINGQAVLFPQLSRAGHAARALAANVAVDYPSFGHEIAQGATTLWEVFTDITDNRDSLNHIMFGTQGAWYYRELAGIGTPAAFAQGRNGSAWRAVELRPRVSCEFLSPHLDLSAVNATVTLARGVVSSSWRILSCPDVPSPPPSPPPSPGPTLSACGVANEHDKYHPDAKGTLTVGCGANQSVSGVAFADFGTPAGSCPPPGGGFRKNASCSTPDAAAIVGAACVGRRACTIGVNVKVFGDPCLGVPKALAVQLRCTDAADDGPPRLPVPAAAAQLRAVVPRAFDWNVSVPVGSSAALHVPLVGAAAGSVSISVDDVEPGAQSSVENSARPRSRIVVWEHGAFVAGVQGLTSATADADGSSIKFAAGSGDYFFQMRG